MKFEFRAALLLLCMVFMFGMASCNGRLPDVATESGTTTGSAPGITSTTDANTTILTPDTQNAGGDPLVGATPMLLPPGTRTPVEWLPIADQSLLGKPVTLEPMGKNTVLAFIVRDGNGLVLEMSLCEGKMENPALLRVLRTTLTDASAFAEALKKGVTGDLVAICYVCPFDRLYTANAWIKWAKAADISMSIAESDEVLYAVWETNADVPTLITPSRFANAEDFSACTDSLKIVVERFGLQSVFPI